MVAMDRPEELLVANGRFESTTWTATALGPPARCARAGRWGWLSFTPAFPGSCSSLCLPSEVLNVGIEVVSGTRGHAAARAV
jgi:hypothetical protein